ncbi:FAD-dependent oxidoreductase [Rhizobium sp. NTR19]|uniref:FAD-dependent oxidoreductase n=1 Tax=Neorhizobium turbinariae TaxID=2937795 RepID=A0ABT0INZ6_9HYPH|nr:FAD-dependent oxidoreductase [Neorhizobium turbinariae]MCK8779585.1 FAD-dependent oxidoreductase [Neorhizobium turbinariae]
MILADGDTFPTENDVCIVGAGPVGLALALRLETLGLNVIVLERGSGETSTPDVPANTEFRNGHHALSEAVSRPGIGGTSALWGGRCVELDDLDFQPRAHVPYSGWPISHDEVRPYYKEAYKFLTCSTGELPSESLGLSDSAVVVDAMERWSKHPALGPHYSQRLARSRNVTVVPSATVTSIDLDAQGDHVQSLALKNAGRAAKVSAKVFVLAGGGLENARLLLSLQTARPDVAARFSTSLGRFYQGHLTGYIAILKFADPRKARSLSFRSDDEGYSYRQRLQIAPELQADKKLLNTVFWIDALSIADPVHGSGALSLCYLFLATSGLYRRMSKGLAPTARGLGNVDKQQHWRNIRQNARWPVELWQATRDLLKRRTKTHQTLFNPKGRYLLRYHAEQVPNPESRVLLKPQSPGSSQAALSVDYRVVDQDIDSVLTSHDLLDAWLRRNRIGQLEYIHPLAERRQAVMAQAFDGYHQIGLSRMADNPNDGPVDRNCKLHGVANLYVAGSGVFPTGGHANPTLPAVALALRLAEQVATTLKWYTVS